MRRSLMIVAALTALSLAPAVLPASAATAATAANAAVQATAANAIVTAVSCAPGGACAAGGRYVDGSTQQAFVLTEANGQWGTAVKVPGLAALNSKNASITAMSCAPGGCVAGGFYRGSGSRYHAFVTSETNGKWNRLITVFTPGKSSTALTQVASLSCSGPRNCTAGGGKPAFAVSEVNGRWGPAHQFLTKGRHNRVMVSCGSAGNCTAGWGGFVATQRNGHWGKTVALPGLGALGGGGTITSLSCAAAANCAAGGTYLTSGAVEVFVADKRNGHWGRAIELPGFTALNQEGFGELGSVSCVSAGNCEAGGSYAAQADFAGGSFQAFVASERGGHWGKAIEVPGIPPPSSAICEPDSNACVAGQTFSVACAPGGACAAGGWYDTKVINGRAAFVTTVKNGHWADVIQVPGLKALDTATFSAVNSTACTPAGKCVAGGSYSTTEQGLGPAFVVDASNGTWGQVHTVLIRG